MNTYAVHQLENLLYPIKYNYAIELDIEGYTYSFYKHEEDGKPCVFVWAEVYYPCGFLLKRENNQLWWSSMDVKQKKVSKEIDGLTYHTNIILPAEWEPFNPIDDRVNTQFLNIVQFLLECES